MVVDPFFCLKISRLKATVREYNIHRCETDSPDRADFATTRHLISRLWHLAQWLGLLLAYCGRHSVICQGALPDMPQPADFFSVPAVI
jgi:hypothetical protein